MLRKLIFVLSAVFISACSLSPVSDQKNNYPTLYVLDGGKINVSDISLFSPGVDKGVQKTLTNSIYVLKHQNGVLVWDTGLPDALIKQKQGVSAGNGAFHLSVNKTLLNQLNEINVKPEDVTHVALSHFHFDHTGNLNLFKSAKILVQEEEFETAFSEDARKYHFDPESYQQINKDSFIKLQGKHDIFGDQSAVIYPAKGHTRGHQVLLLNLEDEGHIILSGDLYHFEKNRVHKRVPSLNINKEQTKQSMADIEELARNTGAQFWIQHDPDQNKLIRHSPLYYQ
jgi:N-acyl homoserine lactone hydrolase